MVVAYRTCGDCGDPLTHPTDSGHGACLYCRLPDILSQQAYLAFRAGWAAREDLVTRDSVCSKASAFDRYQGKP